MTEKQVVKYDVTEAAISKMRDIYMNLTVADVEDQAGFAEVELGRKAVKGYRVATEKQRKVFKADALEYGRMVDSKAKEIFSMLEPIESHLTNEGDKIRNELARIEAEKEAAEKAKIQGRVDDLLKVGVSLDYFTVATMSDEDFNALYATSRTSFEAEQNRLATEEKARLEKEAAEKAEREQKEADLKAEAERQEKVRKEQEAIAAKQKAYQAKLDAVEKTIQDEKTREAFEKQAAENAKAQAEKDAKEEAGRVLEAERFAKDEAHRKLALLPDKEKIDRWVVANLAMPVPEVESAGAKDILRIAVEYIDNILHGVTKQMEEL